MEVLAVCTMDWIGEMVAPVTVRVMTHVRIRLMYKAATPAGVRTAGGEEDGLETGHRAHKPHADSKLKRATQGSVRFERVNSY